MKKRNINKISFIIKTLNKYFPNPESPLHYQNSFTLLIATILSSSSTDKMVNKITPILFQKANTPKKMQKLKLEEIEKIIKPCGLQKIKAKAILEISNILIKKYKSKVPQTLKELLTFPRVGRKTALVVLSIFFQKDEFPVDTHIKRCAKRWGLSHEKKVDKIEKDLKKKFPKKIWKKLHLQIILFARKYCMAKGHKIENCPICSILKEKKNF